VELFINPLLHFVNHLVFTTFQKMALLPSSGRRVRVGCSVHYVRKGWLCYFYSVPLILRPENGNKSCSRSAYSLENHTTDDIQNFSSPEYYAPPSEPSRTDMWKHFSETKKKPEPKKCWSVTRSWQCRYYCVGVWLEHWTRTEAAQMTFLWSVNSCSKLEWMGNENTRRRLGIFSFNQKADEKLHKQKGHRSWVEQNRICKQATYDLQIIRQKKYVNRKEEMES
jgi:hypothetical protein